MRCIFADTFYWIALLNPRGQAHALAVSVSKGLGAVRIVTTEAVLRELLNFFGSRGPHLRRAVAGLVERMQSDPMIDLVA
jgi:predicted nucleic acid-binding protein